MSSVTGLNAGLANCTEVGEDPVPAGYPIAVNLGEVLVFRKKLPPSATGSASEPSEQVKAGAIVVFKSRLHALAFQRQVCNDRGGCQ